MVSICKAALLSFEFFCISLGRGFGRQTKNRKRNNITTILDKKIRLKCDEEFQEANHSFTV